MLARLMHWACVADRALLYPDVALRELSVCLRLPGRAAVFDVSFVA